MLKFDPRAIAKATISGGLEKYFQKMDQEITLHDRTRGPESVLCLKNVANAIKLIIIKLDLAYYFIDSITTNVFRLYF